MRKTLAASALGAAIVLGGPQLAHADSATPAPTPSSTATVTETQHTTTTVTEHDKTGLWGLLGLAGLAGLAGLRKPKREVQHVAHRETPVRETTVRPNHTTTDARRVDDVRSESGVRTAQTDVRPGTDANDVRVTGTNTREGLGDRLRDGAQDVRNDVRRDV